MFKNISIDVLALENVDKAKFCVSLYQKVDGGKSVGNTVLIGHDGDDKAHQFITDTLMEKPEFFFDKIFADGSPIIFSIALKEADEDIINETFAPQYDEELIKKLIQLKKYAFEYKANPDPKLMDDINLN